LALALLMRKPHQLAALMLVPTQQQQLVMAKAFQEVMLQTSVFTIPGLYQEEAIDQTLPVVAA